MTMTSMDVSDLAPEISAATKSRLRKILLELARSEEEMAVVQASAVPYWAAKPESVSGHRAAAAALRAQADRFLEAS